MKQRSVSRKSHKAGLFLFILVPLFVISVTYLVLHGQQNKQNPEVHTASEDVRILFSEDFDHISSVTIDPGEGEPYTLIIEDDTLKLESDKDYPIRSSIVSLIKNNICLVRAENTVIDTAEERISPVYYGFNPYHCKAAITTDEGVTHTVLVGSQIEGETPYYYFMFDEDSRIYSGSTDMFSAFSYELSLLHPVESLTINADILSQVEISGDFTFSMVYTDMGWEMQSPFAYPLSDSFAQGYLDNLSQLSFNRYIGPADEFAESAGLSTPSLTLTMTMGKSIITAPTDDGDTVSVEIPEQLITIHIGSRYNDLYRFAEYNGTVYTMSYYFIDILTGFDVMTAVKINPFQTAVSIIQQVDATFGSQQHAYYLSFEEEKDLNGNPSYDSDGNQLYALQVHDSQGSKIDSDLFSAWFYQLQNIKVLYTYQDQGQPEEEAKAVITLFSALHVRRIAFYALSPTQLLMQVDGTSLFCVDASALENIMACPSP